MTKGSQNRALAPSDHKEESESQPEVPPPIASECSFSVLESRPVKVWTYSESAKCFWLLIATQTRQGKKSIDRSGR